MKQQKIICTLRKNNYKLKSNFNFWEIIHKHICIQQFMFEIDWLKNNDL